MVARLLPDLSDALDYVEELDSVVKHDATIKSGSEGLWAKLSNLVDKKDAVVL